jgi:hypothetical protein
LIGIRVLCSGRTPKRRTRTRASPLRFAVNRTARICQPSRLDSGRGNRGHR